MFLGVEEEGTEPVLAGPQARGERDGHRVGGQDVEGAAFDERGDPQVGEELVCPCRYAFGALAARRPRADLREAEQIRPFDVVEPQDAGE
nr:hypothetical protein [Actinomadura bangladeshensis]